MRCVPVVLAVGMLAACKPAPDGEPAQPDAPVDNQRTIACATDGAPDLGQTCTVERVEKDGGLELVVRHPDGGFRRFTVLTDGRGLAVADGAGQAEVVLADGMLDVAVDGDRYRFPATMKGAQTGQPDAE